MSMRFLLSVVAAPLILPAHAAELHFKVDVLPIFAHSIGDLNNSGAMVGTTSWLTPLGGNLVERAFIYRNGAAEVFVSPNGIYSHSSGEAINDAGVFVGNDGGRALVAYGANQSSPLPSYQDGFSNAYAINNRGQIAGLARFGNPGAEAALWDSASSSPRNLGTLGGVDSAAYGINETGQVVGAAENAEGLRRPFLYTEEEGMQDIGGTLGGWGSAVAINDSSTVVGNFFDSSGGRGFIYANGMASLLALPPGASANAAQDINNDGWVVGHYSWANGPFTREYRGYLYVDGETIDLSALVDPQWTVRAALAINDSRQIAAEVCRASRCEYALLTPVPEPAAWLLFGIGMPILAAARLRRAGRV